MTKELEVAIKAARQAGEILRENFHKAHPVTLKEGGSWVTEIDKLSERKIISIIKENFPTHSVNAEESGFSKKDSEYLWLIDPIDGTTNYATKFPFFAVSIAQAKNKEVILGVVYDPMRNNLYSAEKGKGVRLNSYFIKVSESKELRQSVVSYARPSRIKERFIELFSKVELAARTPKILGSMVLSLCYTASGNLDAAICLSPNPWDLAAGCLIVEEAAGKATDLEGKPWSIDSKDILATNGKIHEEILKIINS
ncbi:MAG: hypothetical protein A2126_03875 [Candidatus Woykebacteria bacterium GWB1_45_5]|uniref:Inositol-1-monophosphatase n=2 Tax=Candidatus Woykeibacteriota TaxID=1817899 RepID=A0A1G1W4W4_9BACT|nr:MAG: hypothetical protein A2113_02355 [Candidatus Woykebacteria bacterium GWA1_44_8]OGY23619.1 MAG: hypothetical protein A2126_03875 [Candidatus Woykebacteria bacterium GWB1_45_5]